MEHKAIHNIKAKSSKVKQLFNSELGLAVLRILEDEFDQHDLRGGSTEETYFNLGRRDVLVYIRQLYEVDGIDG